jgi:hypothetical protein
MVMGACYCWRANLLHRHTLCNIHLAAIPISVARRKSLDNCEDGYGTGVFNFYSSRWLYAEEFQLGSRKIAELEKFQGYTTTAGCTAVLETLLFTYDVTATEPVRQDVRQY